jgi:mono/diheme cytochrome c family protein
MKKLLLVLLPIAVAVAQVAVAQNKSGDAANGKRLFMRNGCYQCHGTVGQGGAAGARLAQIKLPVAAFIAFVRNPPPSEMPPYRAKIMSDQELTDVFAYIQTFPAPLPVASVPILNE